MKVRTQQLILAGLLMAALAGCNSRSAAPTPPQPQTMVQRQEDAAGTGFGIAFRQDPNAIPVVPKDSDVNPVNLPAEPIALK